MVPIIARNRRKNKRRTPRFDGASDLFFKQGLVVHQAKCKFLTWQTTSARIAGTARLAGVSKDRRYCLRIYFFWDDQDQIVVIGDLPHHLDTSDT